MPSTRWPTGERDAGILPRRGGIELQRVVEYDAGIVADAQRAGEPAAGFACSARE